MVRPNGSIMPEPSPRQALARSRLYRSGLAACRPRSRHCYSPRGGSGGNAEQEMVPSGLKRNPAVPMIARMEEFAVRPDPDDPRLTRRVAGIDQEGNAIETSVVTERPLTLFLNG